MIPRIAVFDGFFDDAELARRDIIKNPFQDFQSPFDMVTYPGINVDTPDWVTQFLYRRLVEILGEPVKIRALFSRLTTEGTLAPHKVHSDRIMGEFSAHVYISKDWPAGSGTGFYEHETQGHMHTEDTDEELAAKDSNDLSKWKQQLFVQGLFNRILIHDARAWHCAEPIGGFGRGADDGRIVLTCFFSRSVSP